jgi:hypothetical protein
MDRYFYIHVPGSAGEQLLDDLRASIPPAEVYPDRRPDGADQDRFKAHTSIDYLLSLPPERLDTIRVFTGSFPYLATEMLGLSLFRLTVVTDPVARIRQLMSRQAQRARAGEQDQEQLLAECGARGAPNFQTKLFSMGPQDGFNSHLDPVDIDAARLDRALENLERVDLVGVSDDYGAFRAKVTERCGWPEVTAQGPPLPDAVELDPSLEERIRADNEFDALLYDRAVELAAQPSIAP